MQKFKIIIITMVVANWTFYPDITLARNQKAGYELIKSSSQKLTKTIFAVQISIPDEVKESIRFRVNHGYNVGIVVGVVSPGGTEYYHYGGTTAKGDQNVDEETIFEIGSITKIFTALLLADMVERGELSFHDPIEKYLPNSVRVPKRKNQSITLLSLAMHSSGLPYFPDNLDTNKYPDNPLAHYTVEQMYDFLSNYELKHDIGTHCEYSNTGLALLGHILSLKSGMSYEELVKQRITDELGMTGTAIELTQEMQKRFAKAHTGVIEVPNIELAAAFVGAGALRSTARDMSRFLEACIGLKSTPLQPAFKKIYELLKGPPGTYEKPTGSVWSLRPIGDQTIRWFEGKTLGQNSFIGFIKEKQKAVVVLTNTYQEINDIGFHLLDPNFPLLEWPIPAKVAAKTLAGYAGKYQLESGEIKILFQDGRLILVRKYPKTPFPLKCMLHAKSESEFWNPGYNVQVTFQTDDKGEVISLLLQEGEHGEGQKAKKIGGKAVKPSAEPSQPSHEKLIETDKLKEDLDFLFKTIEEVHPNMYAYTTRERFDPLCQQLYKNVNRPIKSLEFYKLVAPVVASLKSGHTIILPSPNEFKNYVNAGGKVFPLTLHLEGSNVVLTEDNSRFGLPIGAMVLMINQEPASQVLKGLARGFASEGRETKNTCNNLRAMRPEFLRFLMWFEYPPLESWEIQIRTNDGKVGNHTIKSLAIPKIKGDWFTIFEKENTYRYMPKYNTALLELNSFKGDLQEFERFLTQSFKEINDQNISNLIIDVHKNGGGSSSFGDVLLDYLTDQPFRQYERGAQKVSKQACEEDLEEIRNFFSDKSINFGSIVTADAPFQEPSNNPLRFKGRAFVLVSRVTFSAAMDFAAAIKCFNIATLVGQETCDTPVSYGAVLSFNLPNSGLFLLVPHKYFIGACGKPDGHGVIPNYEVKQKPEDTAKGTDTTLQFTLELIKKFNMEAKL